MLFSDKNIILRLNQIERNIEDKLSAISYRALMDVADIKEMLQVLGFRVTQPAPFSILCVSQRKETILMGKTVQVFTYSIDLAPVPESSDAVAQVLTCTGVFVDPSNTAGVYSNRLDREGTMVAIDAVENNEVSVELVYVDSLGNISAEPRTSRFVVIDGIGPDVPVDAMTIHQTGQRAVELPDEEVIDGE